MDHTLQRLSREIATLFRRCGEDPRLLSAEDRRELDRLCEEYEEVERATDRRSQLSSFV